MTALLLAVAVVLTLSILAGLGRVVRGPTSADRLTAALVFGTTGVALLAVLSVVTDVPALRDGALVLVVLAVLAVVVFVGDGVTSGRR